MNDIQKAIDEGRLFRPWWGKEYAYTSEQLKSLLKQVAKEQTSNLRRIIKNEMFIEEPEGEVDRWTNTVVDSVIELLERDDLLVTYNLIFNED